MREQQSMEDLKESWCLNLKTCGYWDIYMSIKVLQWLSTQNVKLESIDIMIGFNPDSLRDSMKNLLNKTLLVDFYRQLTGENPPKENTDYSITMKERFLSIEHSLEDFLSCMIAVEKECQKSGSAEFATIKEWQAWWKTQKCNQQLTDLADINDTEVLFPENSVDMFLEYCRLFYEFGDYTPCRRWLSFFLITFGTLIYYQTRFSEFVVEARDNPNIKLQCLWGLIASNILSLPAPEKINSSTREPDTEEHFVVAKYILTLMETIDLSKRPRTDNIISRLWLIYWTIWPLMRYYFVILFSSSSTNLTTLQNQNLPYCAEWNRIIDWLLSEHTLIFISTTCPQLFRYVAILAILNKHKQDKFEQAVDYISKSSFRYSDIFTSMLESLFVKYNFEEAQEKLAFCRENAASDFLLEPLKDIIEEHARLLIFQTYCQIQKSIDIDMIAKKLYMPSDIAEKWIVSLIRHTRLQAKIDSEKNCVEIASPTISIYQQILEKTKNVLYGTEVLLRDLEKKMNSNGSIVLMQ